MKQKSYTLESVKSCGIRIGFSSKCLFYLDQVGGLPFWKDDDAKRIIAGTFKRFMATIVPEDETHALAQLKIGNREVLSRSYPYSTHWKKLQQKEMDAFDACRKELEERGASPDASERMRTLSERFPVADFRKEPELFRVYELDGEWHLAVIWGISETAEDGLVPVHGFPPFPVYGKHEKSAKWFVLLLVILLALLSLLCWHKYGRTTLVASEPALCIAECRENGLRIEREKERLLPNGKYEVPVRFIVGDAARNPRAFYDQKEIPLEDGGTTEKFLILGAGDHSLSLREAVFVPPPTEVVLNFSLKEVPECELPKFPIVFDEIVADEKTGEYNVPIRFSGIGADISKVQLRVDEKSVPVKSLDGQKLLPLSAGTHDVTLEYGDFRYETKIILPEFPKISISFGEPKYYDREKKYDVDLAFGGLGSSSAKADIVSEGTLQKQVTVNYPGAVGLATLTLDGGMVHVDNAQRHSFKKLLPGRHCASLSVRRDTATATIDLPEIPPAVNIETIVADEKTGTYNVTLKFSELGDNLAEARLRVDEESVPIESPDGQMSLLLPAGKHDVELECGKMKSEKVEITLPEFPEISVNFGKHKADETEMYDVEVIFGGLEENVGIATCVRGGNATPEVPVRYPGIQGDLSLAKLTVDDKLVSVKDVKNQSVKLSPGKHRVKLVLRNAIAEDEIELPEKPKPIVIERDSHPSPDPQPAGMGKNMPSTAQPGSGRENGGEIEKKPPALPGGAVVDPTHDTDPALPPTPLDGPTSGVPENDPSIESGGEGDEVAVEPQPLKTCAPKVDPAATGGSVSQELRMDNPDKKSPSKNSDSKTGEEEEPKFEAVRDEDGKIHISCPNGIGSYKGINIIDPKTEELLGDWNGKNEKGRYSVEMSPETVEIVVIPLDAQGNDGPRIHVPVRDAKRSVSDAGSEEGAANRQPKVETKTSTPSPSATNPSSPKPGSENPDPGPQTVTNSGFSSSGFRCNYERLPDADVGRLFISPDEKTLELFGRLVRAEYDGKACEVKDGRVIIENVEKMPKSTRVKCWCESSKGESSPHTVDFRGALK